MRQVLKDVAKPVQVWGRIEQDSKGTIEKEVKKRRSYLTFIKKEKLAQGCGEIEQDSDRDKQQ